MGDRDRQAVPRTAEGAAMTDNNYRPMFIKAIETAYKGYRFRSRLEARWAVFLDSLGVKWEYEKEGYDLDGVRYLPDFWLPEQKQWMEIKGERNRDGWREAYLLAKHSRQTVAIMYGDLTPCEHIEDLYGGKIIGLGHGWYGDNRCTWPDDPDPFCWGICWTCGLLGMGFYGAHGICGCSAAGRCVNCDIETNRIHVNGNVFFNQSRNITEAFIAARSSRFEHGESPVMESRP